jgi:hypothetical protein
MSLERATYVHIYIHTYMDTVDDICVAFAVHVLEKNPHDAMLWIRMDSCKLHIVRRNFLVPVVATASQKTKNDMKGVLDAKRGFVLADGNQLVSWNEEYHWGTQDMRAVVMLCTPVLGCNFCSYTCHF